METLARIGRFAGRTLALWVLAAAALGWAFPAGFRPLVPFIAPLLGLIMFSMGMTLRGSDFAALLSRPLAVGVGVAAQFTFMPLAGWLVATALALPPELAVGLVLVGACPGGTASNVVVYLARGDVALSVTMTAVATLLAPLLTPLLTLWLGGQWLAISASALFVSILKIVLVPVALGVGCRRLVGERIQSVGEALPLVSVAAIAAIVAAVVAINAERYAEAPLALFAAVALHNAIGLGLGALIGWACGLPASSRRAIAIEVGMQNSGLGAALATAHISPAAALPAALFSVWHNLTGPALATYWALTAESAAPKVAPPAGGTP